MVKLVVSQINILIDQLKSCSYLKMPYTSLLIIYDAEYFFYLKEGEELNEDKLKIKIVDYAFFKESKSIIISLEKNDEEFYIIKSLENIKNLLLTYVS